MIAKPQASAAPLVGRRKAAEALASTLPPLVAEAERVAASITQGVHGRRRVGPGEAFWQYRRYQEGDTIHRIDWRPSAKSTHLFVREREWEAAQSIWIWCDHSASMKWHSSDSLPQKIDRAALLGLALGALAVRGGERIACLDDDQTQIRPMAGRVGLARMGKKIDEQMAMDGPGLPRPRALNRHAQIVLISDFLTDIPALDTCMRGFAAQGLKGHLMQVFDPGEEHLLYSGRIELRDPEGPMKILIGRADQLTQEYEQRVKAHRRQLAASAQDLGWSFSHHITDQPPQTALLALYTALSGTAAQSWRLS